MGSCCCLLSTLCAQPKHVDINVQGNRLLLQEAELPLTGCQLLLCGYSSLLCLRSLRLAGLLQLRQLQQQPEHLAAPPGDLLLDGEAGLQSRCLQMYLNVGLVSRVGTLLGWHSIPGAPQLSLFADMRSNGASQASIDLPSVLRFAQPAAAGVSTRLAELLLPLWVVGHR